MNGAEIAPTAKQIPCKAAALSLMMPSIIGSSPSTNPFS